jgi:hypothetical protein
MRKEHFRKSSITAIKLGRNLWREATETDDGHWPPPWLYASGALITVTTLIILGTTTLTGVLPAAGSLVGSTVLGHLATEQLRTYLEHHSTGLLVSPEELMNLWGIGGLALFIFSLSGNLGARIGWAVFGLISCAAIYQGTAPPAQWTACGLAALAWSILSIIAFRSIGRRETRRQARRRSREESSDDPLGDTRSQAHRNAKRGGYGDLEEYFAERGNQTILIIANELKISKTKVGALREQYLESGISARSRLKPKTQREIREDIRSRELSDSQIRARYGCTRTDINRIRSIVRDQAAEEQVVGDDDS